MMPSRDHQRAEHALATVKDVAGESWQGRYRSYVDRLGPAILRNGLGQALAGELAAAGGVGTDTAAADRQAAHKRLFENAQAWLCGEDRPYGMPPLLDALTSGSEDEYLEAHAEALAWLEWHKRFCRAYLRRADALSDSQDDSPATQGDPG
jgi:CRISPR-associated protein Cmr5